MAEVSPQKDAAAFALAEADGETEADGEVEGEADRDGEAGTDGAGDTLRGAPLTAETDGIGTAEAGATGAATGVAATGAHPAAAATKTTAHNEIPRFRTVAL